MLFRHGKVGQEGLCDRFILDIEVETLAEHTSPRPQDAVADGEELILAFVLPIAARIRRRNLPCVRVRGRLMGQEVLANGVLQTGRLVCPQRPDRRHLET
jgi:hypothetical protein